MNQRTDLYGTDPMLFIREILAKIRKEVPDSFVIGIRLGEFKPPLDDAVQHTIQLEEMGIDFIDVSYGFQKEQEISCPDGYPFMDIIYAAEMIRKAVNIPVFAANGITSPEMAEQVLERTDATQKRNTGKCLHCLKCRLYDAPEKCPGKILFNKTIANRFYIVMIVYRLNSGHILFKDIVIPPDVVLSHASRG